MWNCSKKTLDTKVSVSIGQFYIFWRHPLYNTVQLYKKILPTLIDTKYIYETHFTVYCTHNNVLNFK